MCEGAKRPSGGRVWEGCYGRDFLKIRNSKYAFLSMVNTCFKGRI